MNTKLYSILTSLLTIVGTFLIGRTVFGAAVDESLWQTIVGGILAIAGLIMCVLDKTLTIEKTQAFLRTAIMAVGGFLIAAGKATPEKIETWLGIITSLVPMVYTWLSKRKSEQIASAQISVYDLKKL